MLKEVGTLAEIGAKVGDVVEMVDIADGYTLAKGHLKISEHGNAETGDGGWYEQKYDKRYSRKYRIVSREPTESTSSPVRTVTRKEIVPGVYGKVCVSNDGKSFGVHCLETRADILAAIATLQQIAEALDA